MALTTEELEELARLAPAARTARRQHSPDSPSSRASERFTDILVAALERGSTVRELADATGISYHSVARRIRVRTGSNISRKSRSLSSAPPAPPAPSEEEKPSGAQELVSPAPGEPAPSEPAHAEPAPAPTPAPAPAPARRVDPFTGR